MQLLDLNPLSAHLFISIVSVKLRLDKEACSLKTNVSDSTCVEIDNCSTL